MKIEIELPDPVEYSEHDIIMIIANKLYEEGIIGLYIGGKIAGISRLDFMDEMVKYGVAVFDAEIKELREKH